MRHVVIRRTAFGLGAVCVGCALLFVRLVNRPGDPGSPAAPRELSGAAVFQAHCASCHAPGELRASMGNVAARRTELLQLLDAHGESSAVEDRLVLDYLERGGPDH